MSQSARLSLMVSAAVIPAPDSARPSIALADDTGSFTALLWIAVLLFRFLAWTTQQGNAKARAASPPPSPPSVTPLSPVESGYAIPCPMCGKRDLREARRVEVLHGKGLWPTVEWHVIAGCTPCVRERGIEMLRLNLRNGFKTAAGVLVTPSALLLGAWRVYGSPSEELADETVRGAGLDPDEVRLNAHGVTRSQQRMVNAAAFVFAPVIWADGDMAVRSHQRAARAMRRLANDRLPPDHATALLSSAHLSRAYFGNLGAALSGTLFRMLREVAIAEGQLSRRRLDAVYAIGARLGRSTRDVDALLGDFKRPQAEPGSSREQRERQHQRDRDSWRDQRYHAPPIMGDVALARSILAVDAMATYVDIQRSYRILIARFHPDRAGPDPRVIAERTKKTQELTWAMGVLRRAAYRGVS